MKKLTFALLLFSATNTFAHSGRTDASGCHTEYEWQDMNVGPSGEVALSNFVCTPSTIEKPPAPPQISEEKRNALQNCLTLQSGEAIAKCLNKK